MLKCSLSQQNQNDYHTVHQKNLNTILEQTKSILGNNISVNRQSECLTNTLYQVHTHRGLFALRINAPDSKRLGINRHRELAILELIDGQDWNLSPAAKSLDYLLTPWVLRETAKPVKTVDTLIRLLESVHGVDTSTISTSAPININDQIEFLLAQTPRLNQSFLSCLNQYRHRYQFPNRLVLCHHDWHNGNILSTQTNLYINDWEYAALGDPLVDTVCAIQGFMLAGKAKQEFLQKSSITEPQIDTIEPLVNALSILWYQVRFPEWDRSESENKFIHTWS